MRSFVFLEPGLELKTNMQKRSDRQQKKTQPAQHFSNTLVSEKDS